MWLPVVQAMVIVEAPCEYTAHVMEWVVSGGRSQDIIKFQNKSKVYVGISSPGFVDLKVESDEVLLHFGDPDPVLINWIPNSNRLPGTSIESCVDSCTTTRRAGPYFNGQIYEIVGSSSSGDEYVYAERATMTVGIVPWDTNDVHVKVLYDCDCDECWERGSTMSPTMVETPVPTMVPTIYVGEGTFYDGVVSVCPGGYYQNGRGATECQACPAGRYLEDVMLASYHDELADCKECGLGTYALEGSSECTQCPAGKQGTLLAAASESDCAVCGFGTYSTHGTCLDCPAGTYLDDAGTFLHASLDDCLDCPAGRYSLRGASHCTACPAGRFAASPGTSPNDCMVCDAGSVAPEAGMTQCHSCEAGTFLSDAASHEEAHDAWNDCDVCSSGKFSSVGASTCDECEAGTFIEDQALIAQLHLSCSVCDYGTYAHARGSSACVACPAGTSLADDGRDAQKHDHSSDCTACDDGSFSDEGAQYCTLCPVGRHSLNGDCAICGAGKYASKAGSHECSECPIGTYLTDAGQDASLHVSLSQCSTCPAGQHSDEAAASCSLCEAGTGDCEPCEQGKYQSEKGQASCEACAAGKFSNVTGATTAESCLSCPVDTYCPVAGCESCLACPAGETSEQGSLACASAFTCQAGTFEIDGVCQECPECSYSDVNGATECSTCPGGRYNSKTGQTACLQTPDGFYETACSVVPCRAGSYSNATTDHLCREADPGYFATDSLTDSDGKGVNSAATAQAPCPAGSSSTKAGQFECSLCAAGKYATSAAQCSECPAGVYGVGGDATASCSGPCAAGYVGEPGARFSTCSMKCPAGYFCPEGTAVGSEVECGGIDVYCPEGSSLPTPANPGDYTLGGDATTRRSAASCPTGSYCLSGIATLCPGGRFAPTLGSGSCSTCDAGHYCSVGASSQKTCGDGLVQPASVYCPEASSAPVNLTMGEISVPYWSSIYTRTASVACFIDEDNKLGEYCPGDGTRAPSVYFDVCNSTTRKAISMVSDIVSYSLHREDFTAYLVESLPSASSEGFTFVVATDLKVGFLAPTSLECTVSYVTATLSWTCGSTTLQIEPPLHPHVVVSVGAFMELWINGELHGRTPFNAPSLTLTSVSAETRVFSTVLVSSEIAELQTECAGCAYKTFRALASATETYAAAAAYCTIKDISLPLSYTRRSSGEVNTEVGPPLNATGSFSLCDHQSPFRIEACTGQIYVNEKLTKSTQVCVIVTNGDQSASTTVQVIVEGGKPGLAVEAEPTLCTVYENTRGPVTCTGLIANNVTWHLNDPYSILTIDRATGRFAAALLDYEERSLYYGLEIWVEADGVSDKHYVTLEVLDANDPPYFDSRGAVFWIPEHTSRVGELTAQDQDGDTLRFTVTAPFTMDGLMLMLEADVDYETTPYLYCGVTVSDGTTNTSGFAYVGILDVNDAPVAESAVFFVFENASLGSVIGTLYAEDPDGDALTWTSEDLVIDDGVVRLNRALDFETLPRIDISVEVQDPAGLSAHAVVTIVVLDVNEAPTMLARHATPDTCLELDENAPPTRFYELLDDVVDPDVNQTHAFDLEDENFAADPTLRSLRAFDYEEQRLYFMRVRARDEHLASDFVTLCVRIRDVNEAPILQPIEARVLVGLSIGSTIGYLDGVDPDGDDLVFSATGFEVHGDELRTASSLDDVGTFVVEYGASDGELTSTANVTLVVSEGAAVPSIVTRTLSIAENAPVPTFVGEIEADAFLYSLSPAFFVNGSFLYSSETFDFETRAMTQVRLAATDGVATTYETLIVTVLDVPEPPSVPAQVQFSVAEDATTVGFVRAVDQDADDTLFYELRDLPGFHVVDGDIFAPPLDYETRKAYAGELVVRDSFNLSAVAALTILVMDVNEPPEWPELHDLGTVVENSGFLPISTFEAARDPEHDTLDYQVFSPLFVFQDSKLCVRDAGLDYENRTSHTFQARAMERDTADRFEVWATFHVSVGDVNDMSLDEVIFEPFSTSGGDLVVFNGKDVGTGIVTATYGDYQASDCTVVDSSVACTTAAGVGVGHSWNITVGRWWTVPKATTRYAAPRITQVEAGALSTPGGELVTIKGSNLGLSSVSMNEFFDCAPLEVSSEVVTCVAGPGYGDHLVFVITVGGQASLPFASTVSYAAPEITEVVSPLLSTEGSEQVRIKGANFGPVGSVEASYGPYQARGCSILIAHLEIVCWTVAGVGRDLKWIVSRGGLSEASGGTSSYAPPSIYTVSSVQSATTGGDTITVTGSNFGLSAQLTYGPYDAAACVASHRVVTCKTVEGVGANHLVRITVGNQSDARGNVSYAPPYVTSFETEWGTDGARTRGGQTIIVKGGNFGPFDSVKYGDSYEPSCVLLSTSRISCVTAAATGTDHAWTVVVGGQESTTPTTKTRPPHVSQVSPTNLSTAGGQVLKIRGGDFGSFPSKIQVSYGPSGAEFSPNCTLLFDSEIQCTSVPGIGVDLQFRVTVDGQSTLSASLASYELPELLRIVPDHGPTAGVSVYFEGRNLVGDFIVVFDGTVYEAPFRVPELVVGSHEKRVVLRVGGLETNPLPFLYDAPVIDSVIFTHEIELRGSNFGSSGEAWISGRKYATKAYSHDLIRLDFQGSEGTVEVRVNELTSNAVFFKSKSPEILEVHGLREAYRTVGGRNVTLTGTDFVEPAVFVGEHEALVISSSRDSVTFEVPAGSGTTNPITLYAAGRPSPSVSNVKYLAPVVFSVSRVGVEGGRVVLRGDNLWRGTLGSATILVHNHTTLIFEVEPGGGRVPLELDVADQKTAFVLAYDAPRIDSIEPRALATVGGTLVIRGSNFWNPHLKFDFATELDIVGSNATTVRARVGPSQGINQLTMNCSGLIASFDYTFAAPSLDAVEEVPTEGGVVIVTGRNLGVVPSQTDVAKNYTQTWFALTMPPGQGSVPFKVTTCATSCTESNVIVVEYAQATIDYVADFATEERPGYVAHGALFLGPLILPTSGSDIAVVGKNFGTDPSASLGAILESSHDLLILRIPRGSGELSLSVRGSAPFMLKYDPPVITWVTPNAPDADGDTLRIVGTNFGDEGEARIVIDNQTTVTEWHDETLYCRTPRVTVGVKTLEIYVAEQNTSYDVTFRCGDGYYGQEKDTLYTIDGRCFENCSKITHVDEFCTKCPRGSWCAKHNTLDPVEPMASPGYYRVIVARMPRYTYDFRACVPGASCLGNNTCARGYRGSVCSKCSNSYYKRRDECIRCPSLVASVVVTAILSVIALCLYRLRRDVNLDVLAIGLDYVQILSLLSEIQWPPLLSSVWLSLRVFNFNFPTECAVAFNLRWLLVELAVLPLFFTKYFYFIYLFITVHTLQGPSYAPLFLVYTFGYPLVALRFRHTRFKRNSWVCLILVRKMFMAFVTLASPAHFQLALLLFVLFVSLVVQMKYLPYVSPRDKKVEPKRLKKQRLSIKKEKVVTFFFEYNTVEGTLLSCAILVCLAGIMLDNQYAHVRHILVALTILVLLASLLYLIAVLWYELAVPLLGISRDLKYDTDGPLEMAAKTVVVKDDKDDIMTLDEQIQAKRLIASLHAELRRLKTPPQPPLIKPKRPGNHHTDDIKLEDTFDASQSTFTTTNPMLSSSNDVDTTNPMLAAASTHD